MKVNVNTHPNVIRDMVAARNRNRKAGKVETIFGTKRFMSVATINRMRKADLDDWLFQRGFMPELSTTTKRKGSLNRRLEGRTKCLKYITH